MNAYETLCKKLYDATMILWQRRQQEGWTLDQLVSIIESMGQYQCVGRETSLFPYGMDAYRCWCFYPGA